MHVHVAVCSVEMCFTYTTPSICTLPIASGRVDTNLSISEVTYWISLFAHSRDWMRWLNQ